MVAAKVRIADAARASGFPGETALVADSAAAGPVLAERLRPGDCVLLKASRGVEMEKALQAWRKLAAEA